MRRDLVVVGASSGGVEALRALVAGLPPGLNAAVLVVLHIPPGAPSALPQILSRAGPLPAVAAEDGAPLNASRIHVGVADHQLLVRDGRIGLTREATGYRHRPAIDPLFHSAAAEYGPRVIGVILSGAQDDGIAGLTAVVESGGVAIVQDPDTAVHDSMPRAALRRLSVPHVLPPEEIGGVIAELVADPYGGDRPEAGHAPA